MKKSKETLKKYFEKGNCLTEQKFVNLIDSLQHIDGGVTTPTTGSQTEFKTVFIDAVNGDDTTAKLENKSFPFATIQVALNTIRETSGYTPVSHSAHIQPAFWDVVILESGTYAFEYVSIANVRFISKSDVIIKIISTGKHFTNNKISNTNPHYDVARGSLDFDMPNGEFQVISLDNTLTFRPEFDLRSLDFTNLKKLRVNFLTSITSFNAFLFRIYYDGVDFNGIDVETNVNLINIASNANRAKFNFGNINIVKVDEATDGAVSNVISFCRALLNIKDVSFSFNEFNCAINGQTSNAGHVFFECRSKLTSSLVLGDFTALGTFWNIIRSSHDAVPTIVFNNSSLTNCNVTISTKCTFTGRIKETSETRLLPVGGNNLSDILLDGLQANFNLNDDTSTIPLNLWQVGLNDIGSPPTATIEIRNCTIVSKYSFLRTSSHGSSLNPLKFSKVLFTGLNFIESTSTDYEIVAYLNFTGRVGSIQKEGRLFLKKGMDPQITLIEDASINTYYTEII